MIIIIVILVVVVVDAIIIIVVVVVVLVLRFGVVLAMTVCVMCLMVFKAVYLCRVYLRVSTKNSFDGT